MSSGEKRAGRFRVLHGIEVAALVVVLMVTIQVTYQFFYASDRALPGATMLGERVEGKTFDEMAARVQERFQSQELTISTDKGKYTAKLADYGASARAAAMAEQVIEYPISERLTPFSIFLKRPAVDAMAIRFDSGALEEQSKKVAASLSRPMKDASIAMEPTGELKIVKAEVGHKVEAKDIVTLIQKSDFRSLQKGVRLNATPIVPSVTDAQVQDVASDVRALTERTLTIRVDEDTITPSKADVVQWFGVVADDKGMPTVTVQPARIDAYVKRVTGKYYKKPVARTVQVIDDVEQSPQGGASGERVDRAAIVAQLTDGINKRTKEQVVVAKKVAIAPSVRYVRKYTASHQGLQAYVSNAAARYNAKIAVQQLDGTKWRAQAREWDSIPSASTYKLYVTLELARRIDSGAMRWSDGMQNTNVAGCFERMIVVSTNVCAEDFIGRFGRSELNNAIHSKGFSKGTGFLFSDAARTTAGDLRSYLVRLYNRQLMSDANRDILLGKMGRQIWRKGIPAGTRAPVQNKVGFLWSYAHDAGIVYHPRGAYVLVVMTKGQSFARIAQITREIEKILYP